jgi:hypothetical protein
MDKYRTIHAYNSISQCEYADLSGLIALFGMHGHICGVRMMRDLIKLVT